MVLWLTQNKDTAEAIIYIYAIEETASETLEMVVCYES